MLVVGGSTGIGRAAAIMLAQEGHRVYATYNETTGLPDSDNLSYHFLNVADGDYDLSFAPDQLDGLVYCPGSINLKPFHRINPQSFIDDFSLQVVGAIKVIQSVLPNLKQAEQSSIVLFSTVAVQSGFNFHTQVAASKGAVEGFTRALAAEMAPRIRVNAIAPSITDTPLAHKLLSTDEKKANNAQRHPLKKIGAPEDIAHMVSFLLSDKSNWITGQIMSVDGGMSSLKI